MRHAQAIVWAQWRSLRNFYPRGGIAWTAIAGAIWYGFWILAALTAARLVANPANLGLMRTALPGALLIVFLYWQAVPLLMAATGASLELRKLKAYPIPVSQLFAIEVLLRTTAGIEMILIALGVAAGVLLNPDLSGWCALALIPFVLFNLFLAVGVRDLLLRVLARKRIREIAFILLLMCGALPQLLLTRGSGIENRLRALFARDVWMGWPWTAAANLIQGLDLRHSPAILLAWMFAAALFGRWQFTRTLSFDAEAAGARNTRPTARRGMLEVFYRLPSALFADPLAALIEKEVRSLMRAPRFRLVFLMGFTFGLIVWLPMAIGRTASPGSFLGTNYLTVVSVYSLLLLSEVCFWNSFGFDRSAAQVYFLAPIRFSQVLIGKNVTALFFIALEISAITTVCALLRMPLDPRRLVEAYSVAGVICIFMVGAGNLLSIYQVRAVNPATSFRSGAAGRVQAILFVIYPLAFFPAALAYLARWAFDAEAAFFVVLGLAALAGLIVYRISLDSAVEAAERLKEKMIAALSVGEGPIAG